MNKTNLPAELNLKRRHDPLADAVDAYIRELTQIAVVSSPAKSKNLAMAATLVSGLAMGAASTAEASTFTVTNNNDSGAGSLRDAVTNANANHGPDTILFSGAGASGVTTLTSGELYIKYSGGPLTITGPGADRLAIDGDNESRVIRTRADTTITGLTLQNGRSARGSGIYIHSSTLVLRNSVISGNTATDSGGGIYSEEAYLRIYDSTIYGNYADNYGGGISVNYENLRLIRSTVSGNEARDGGGISLYAEEEGPYIYINDSLISHNSARYDGGGIFFGGDDYVGTLTIRNSTITGNNAGDDGGGIMSQAGEADERPEYAGIIRIYDSVISDNYAGDDGGGIAMYGDDYVSGLSVRRTTISGNTAHDDGGGLAIYSDEEGNMPQMYFFYIYGSTIANNSAGGDGGGIAIYQEGSENADLSLKGRATIGNTTISGNTADNRGGGLAMLGYGYGLHILNSTVTNNYSGSGGGGIYFDESTEENFIRNSIVSGNRSEGGDANLYTGESFYSYYSIIESFTGTVKGSSTSNQFGVDPLLGPLANNGGPTMTHALLPGSPAIDAGDPGFAGGPTGFDQRTTSPGQGFLRVTGSSVDIGAVEFGSKEVGAPVPVPTLSRWALWLLGLLLPASAMAWIARRKREEELPEDLRAG